MVIRSLHTFLRVNHLNESSYLHPGTVLKVKSGHEPALRVTVEEPVQLEQINCQIWKLEVAYCTQVGKVKGMLTLTQYFMMFDPTLTDGSAYVFLHGDKHAVPAQQFQCFINMQDVLQSSYVLVPALAAGDNDKHVLQIVLGEEFSKSRRIDGNAKVLFLMRKENYSQKITSEEKKELVKKLVARINQLRGTPDTASRDSKTVLPYFDEFRLPVESTPQPPEPRNRRKSISEDNPHMKLSVPSQMRRYSLVVEAPTIEDSASPIPVSPIPVEMRAFVKFTEAIDSIIIDEEMQEQLARQLPKVYQIRKWKLVYRPQDHGCSLRVLYKNACEFGATLLLVQDEGKRVFGGFITEPLRVTKKFYGTGEGFLFSFSKMDKIKVYHPTYQNEYYIISDLEALMFGAGGAPGLYIAQDLLRGSSGRCDTYGNDVLASTDHFNILNLELWGFV